MTTLPPAPDLVSPPHEALTAVQLLIDQLPSDSALRPLGLDRVKVVSACRRLAWSRQHAPDRARWGGLWFERLAALEAASVDYPLGPMSSPDYEPLTKHEYDRIAQVLRDAENELLIGTRWDTGRRTVTAVAEAAEAECIAELAPEVEPVVEIAVAFEAEPVVETAVAPEVEPVAETSPPPTSLPTPTPRPSAAPPAPKQRERAPARSRSSHGPSWIDGARRARVLEVAQRLGLSTAPPRGSSGGVIYTCPACSAERQHNGRRHVYQGGTGVGVRRDGLGWHCFACDVSGDAIALSCFKLAGGGKYKDLSRTTQQEVRAWWIDYLGNATTVDSEPAAAPASDPRASQPLYPPPNEIEEFKKQHCVRLDEHPQTLAWCSKHLVNATSVADQRLAIALAPRDPFPTFPAWAYCGKRTWLVLGYLVIVRLYDARGELRSYLARTVDAEPKGPAKSLGAQGFPRAGLVMACPLAQQMLRFGTHPSQWPAQSSGANVEPLRWPVEQPFRVMIAEGERDYLALASSAAAADVCRPAIMGIYSGSWTREIASRIPDGTRVILLRDDDAAGHKYARTIAETLAGRCDFRVRDGGSRG